MDEIRKFIRGLSKKERQALLLVLEKVRQNPLSIPGIVKLQNHKTLYRVRMGNIRIILDISKNNAEILRIARRNEKSYKGL